MRRREFVILTACGVVLPRASARAQPVRIIRSRPIDHNRTRADSTENLGVG
jgi:hypothetical protein